MHAHSLEGLSIAWFVFHPCLILMYFDFMLLSPFFVCEIACSMETGHILLFCYRLQFHFT